MSSARSKVVVWLCIGIAIGALGLGAATRLAMAARQERLDASVERGRRLGELYRAAILTTDEHPFRFRITDAHGIPKLWVGDRSDGTDTWLELARANAASRGANLTEAELDKCEAEVTGVEREYVQAQCRLHVAESKALAALGAAPDRQFALVEIDGDAKIRAIRADELPQDVYEARAAFAAARRARLTKIAASAAKRLDERASEEVR